MAVKRIRYYRNPVLRRACREVKTVDDTVRRLLGDMMDTLHHSEDGAALAANQVGILLRLVVVDYEGNVLKLVNPRIVEQSGRQDCVAGCLSFPGIVGKTVRPQKVTVLALDENGDELCITGEGEMAKCFCHELDHLDGILFPDRASALYKVKKR